MPRPTGCAQVCTPWPLPSFPLHGAANDVQRNERLGPIGVTDLGAGRHVASPRFGPSTGSCPVRCLGSRLISICPDKGSIAHMRQERIGRPGPKRPFAANGRVAQHPEEAAHYVDERSLGQLHVLTWLTRPPFTGRKRGAPDRRRGNATSWQSRESPRRQSPRMRLFRVARIGRNVR